MATLGRRFVNIVAAGKYKPGMLSVHGLDVSKHLFYPSASEARSVVGGDDGDGEAPRRPTTKALQELPAPCAIFKDAPAASARTTRSAAFLSPLSDGSRILFINEAGDSKMYFADDEGSRAGHTHAMPSFKDFAGPVAASVSVVAQQAGGGAAKEESLYVIHGVRDGVAPRFHVLRPPTDRRTGVDEGEGWYWKPLPPPPFVCYDDDPKRVISSYTVVEGGRTICVSPYALADGTWCFDTVRGEWWHAGDWDMPFYAGGRAEYLADLDLWLGFCCSDDGELCTTAGLSLSAMAAKNRQPPTELQHLYTPPEHWMMAIHAKQVQLINLGSGRFAIAKIFSWDQDHDHDYDYTDFEFDLDDDDDDEGIDSTADDVKYEELLVVDGVEIRPRQPRDGCDIWSCSDGLELIPHKSISYKCGTHKIHQVL